MFVYFGPGKCPLCGDFGAIVEDDVYHCGKCTVSFNNFYIVATETEQREEGKFWN